MSNEHNNTPAVPQGAIGWIPKWAFARLTGELGGKADPVTWGLHAPIYAKAPGSGDGVAIYATPSPAPAQEPMQSFTVPDDLPGMWEHSDLTGGETDCAKPAQEPAGEAVAAALGDIIAMWDHHVPSEYVTPLHMQAKRALEGQQPVSPDMHGWCAYVGGMVAHWIRSEPDAFIQIGEERFEAAIAGIIERRLWAMPKDNKPTSAPKPAQEVTLTGCNCRWDGSEQVQWCELHLAHKEAIHEWADRAKTAEAKLDRLSSNQDAGLTDEEPAHVAGLLEHRRELDAIEFFESTNRDSYEFKKSVRGIYVNPAVARDWKWFQLGMKHATEDES